METRKIQEVGGGTYTVSLPKDWAESEDVTAGEVVNLHTHIDGLLVIQTREREDTAGGRVAVQVDHDDSTYLKQILLAAYAAGSKEVHFDTSESFTGAQRRVIERVARNLPGVTVSEESASRVTVQTMLDSNEVSIRQSVRQLKFIALSMHRDATAVLTDDVSPDRLTDLDDQADRLYAMIDRHVARGLSRLDEIDALGLTRSELFELWVTARELERVADHAENIVAIGTKTNQPVEAATAEEVNEIACMARDVVEDAVSVIVGDAEVETARRALNVRDQVREETEAIDRRLFGSAAGKYRLTHILDSLRRTAEHGGNIAELGLRMAIRRGDLTEAGIDKGEKPNRNQEFRAATDTEG